MDLRSYGRRGWTKTSVAIVIFWCTSLNLNLYVRCLFHSISMQVMHHGHVLYFCTLTPELNELASSSSVARQAKL